MSRRRRASRAPERAERAGAVAIGVAAFALLLAQARAVQAAAPSIDDEDDVDEEAADDVPTDRAGPLYQRSAAALLPPSLSLAPPTVGRDYDAPKPVRAPLDFARAAAYTALTNYLVFQVDWLLDRPFVRLSARHFRRNFVEGFEWDDDPLQTNFFGHPLHGSFYFAGARAAGLTFWESIPFTFAGSAMWEFFGENELPSANDLFATSVGGVFLGEVLHRISSQILDESRSGGARVTRELLAAMVDPPRGLDRVLTGQAWRRGEPPARRYMRLALDFGVDRVRLARLGEQSERNLTPSLLLAVDVKYGDLQPPPGKDTIGPLETFDLYAAANLFQSELTGAQVFERGVLYGFSSDLTRDEGPDRDNNVFGFFQTFDFQGANLATYGAMGFGPGDEIVLHSRRFGHLRAGASMEWVPVLGITSQNVGSSPRTYNIATGVASGLYATWDSGRPGRLSLRARQYLGAVVDGAAGYEMTGYVRLSYEVDLIRDLLGIGLAPTFSNRRSDYRVGPDQVGTQIATQLYIVLQGQ